MHIYRDWQQIRRQTDNRSRRATASTKTSGSTSKDTVHTVDGQGCPNMGVKSNPTEEAKKSCRYEPALGPMIPDKVSFTLTSQFSSTGTWSWQSMIAGLKRPRIKLGDPAQATSFISRASCSTTSWGANPKQGKLVGDATSFQLNGGLFSPVDGLKSSCSSILQDGGHFKSRDCLAA